MNNWCICWFSRIFLLEILIFTGLTARLLYKSFGVKGLNRENCPSATLIYHKLDCEDEYLAWKRLVEVGV
jgi:hypothetical protein